VFIINKQLFSGHDNLEDAKQLNCSIRNIPITISKKDIKNEMGLNNYWRPIEFNEMEYAIVNDGAIIDNITGLMWQQAGSRKPLRYDEIKQYINKMNEEKTFGYDDWRIPTLQELISILGKGQYENDLYIHPYFNPRQKWIWSSDKTPNESKWLVDFFEGNIFMGDKNLLSYVRSVRCSQ
jgi:serine/threonine-protein kinase